MKRSLYVSLLIPAFAAVVTAPLSAITAETAQAVNPVAASSAARPRMEVVFVLDTTGSMSAMIEGAKRKIWAIASKLQSAQPTPEIRFGLVAYRDRGDVYVTRVHALTTNLDTTYETLMGFKADGGDDTPEAVNQALTSALEEIQWSRSPDVMRAIFLIGDAPPHMDYQNDVKWTESCRRAQARGILINTLQCGGAADTEAVWQAIAQQAGGAYLAIQDQGRTTEIATRFDADIVDLTRELNATIVPYGSREAQAEATRSAALIEAMSAEGVADRSAFLARSDSGAVIAGKGDLVAELLAGRIAWAAIDPALLEPALRALSDAERMAVIRTKLERRQQLQGKLGRILAERAAVVEEQLNAASADEIIVLSPFEVLTDQAEAKGYRFK